MANNKFVVKNGAETPNIDFVSPNKLNKITVDMLDSDTLSVSGDSGQLFSITDSLTGTIFAVNDISGVPSIEVDDTGEIRLAETFGNVLIGTATDTGEKLQVNGKAKIATVDNGVGNFLTRNANGVITQRTAAEVLADIGGEGGFAKGNLVQGSNVTLSGTLTNRLVGTGDVTINADGTNLAEGIRTATTVLVTSSTGTSATLNIATATLAGMMSAEDKAKLNGIPSTAEENQHAFSNVAVSGQSTVAADSKTDTLTLISGANITITTDAVNDSVTFAATNTTYTQATSSVLGLVKLGSDTAQTVAANTVTATASRSYAVQLNASGQMLVNVPWSNTTYAAGNGLTLSGTTFNVGAGSYITVAADTVAVDATSANTASKVVARDSSGNFSAGTITAALTGNASTATTLATSRTINGISFNGSANITVPATYGEYFGITNTSSTSGLGLSLYGTYSTGAPAYGIMFAGTDTFGTHGAVTADWATYFTMNSTAGRGWIFKAANAGTGSNIASISNTGVITAVDFNATSDERKKHDISTAPSNVIRHLRGVEFKWNENDRQSSGVIAQELERIVPHAVSTDGDGFKSVNYNSLVAYLIEAIKDQQRQIDELRIQMNT